MKKLICLVLVAIMLASMAACSVPTDVQQEEFRGTFQAGYSRVDVTPELPIKKKDGGSYTEIYKHKQLGYEDRLYATCVAVSDGENVALFYTVDVGSIGISPCDSFKKNISEATGVPYDNIVLAATHTHTSVVPTIPNTDPANMRWVAAMNDAFIAAANEAMADFADVEVHIGSQIVKNMAYVRRYIYNDGEPGGIWRQAARDDQYATHYESEADNSVQVIRFKRENKKDIVIANLQTHFTDMGGYINYKGSDGKTVYPLSSDLAGMLRYHVESMDEDALFAVYVGASGNVAPGAHLGDKTREYVSYATKEGSEHALKDNVGYVVSDVIVNMPLEKVEPGIIQSESRILTVGTNKPDAEKVAQARLCKAAIDNLYTYPDGKNEKGEYYYDGNADVYVVCKEYGFESAKEVEFTISHADNYGATTQVPLAALSFGELGFVTSSYEMFDTNGMQIKEASPFTMTFVITNAGGSLGYVPSALAVPNGGYEVYTSPCEYGTAERAVAEFIDMLNAQKGIS